MFRRGDRYKQIRQTDKKYDHYYLYKQYICIPLIESCALIIVILKFIATILRMS